MCIHVCTFIFRIICCSVAENNMVLGVAFSKPLSIQNCNINSPNPLVFDSAFGPEMMFINNVRPKTDTFLTKFQSLSK